MLVFLNSQVIHFSSMRHWLLFSGALNRCLTPDAVFLLYSSLALVLLTLACTLVQLLTNLNCSSAFIKKLQSRGAFDIISGNQNLANFFKVFLCSLSLGLICWAASLVARFQFQQISMEFHIPSFSSSNETVQYIQNVKQRIESFSIAYSGGFYFVLLAGFFSVIALATRNFLTPITSLR